MAAFTVVIADFGDPDDQVEAAILAASGLDIELVRVPASRRAVVNPQVLAKAS